MGFTAVRVAFDSDTDADPDEVDTLLRLTERYRVVGQTRREPPSMSFGSG